MNLISIETSGDKARGIEALINARPSGCWLINALQTLDFRKVPNDIPVINRVQNIN